MGSFLRTRRDIRSAPLPRRRRADTDERYRRWLEQEQVDVVLVSSWLAADATRGKASGWTQGFLASLRQGALGFEPALDERTRYFTQDLYTSLDPMFDTQPTAGLIGYEVFVRKGTSETAQRPKP